MYKKDITIEEDRTVIGLEAETMQPGRYSVYMVQNDNPEDYRKFYRVAILPHVIKCFVELTGYPSSDMTAERMHRILKIKCNAEHTTAGMNVMEWKRFLLCVQSYTINILQGDWPF